VLVQRLYAACCTAWRQLTLREFCALQQASGEAPPVPAAVAALEAQCLAIADSATVAAQFNALQDAEASADAEPLHPVQRLFRHFSDAELARLCDGAPDVFYPWLLDVAPAYIDVDVPMGGQGL